MAAALSSWSWKPVSWPAIQHTTYDLDPGVPMEQRVGALVRVVAHEREPALGLGGVLEQRVAQLGQRQRAHAGTHVYPRARAGASRRTTSASSLQKALSTGSGRSPATGKSLPCTSWPIPTAVARARIASGP